MKPSKKENLEQFNAFIKNAKKLVPTVLNSRIEELKKLLKSNKGRDFFKLTTFELMEHNFRENTHSNVLQYLFDPKLFLEGASLLSDFIEGINEVKNKQQLLKMIKEGKYSVEREVPTEDRKRMDIVVEDKQKRFIIVIENKVFAGISHDDEGKSQTAYYSNFINKKPHKEKVFILFSWNEQSDSNWQYCNYEYLYNILSQKKYQNIDDNIFSEYSQMLFWLLQRSQGNRRSLILFAKDVLAGNLKKNNYKEAYLLENIEHVRRLL